MTKPFGLSAKLKPEVVILSKAKYLSSSVGYSLFFGWLFNSIFEYPTDEQGISNIQQLLPQHSTELLLVNVLNFVHYFIDLLVGKSFIGILHNKT